MITHSEAGLLSPLIAGVIFQQLFDFPGNKIALLTPTVISSLTHRATHRRPVHPSGLARRKDIGQCRSLRLKIQDYEAKFEEARGRKPRANERGDLGDVYAQYRVLKQRIRG